MLRTIAPIDGAERADLLIHALAQLRDSISLHLREPLSPALEAVAHAYGVRDRVLIGRSGCDFDIDPDAAARAGSFASLVEPLYQDDDSPAPTIRGDDSLLTGERFALATNMPAPYRIPLFRLVARRLHAAGADLLVLFETGSSPRSWMNVQEELAFPHRVLRGVTVPRMRRSPTVPLNLDRHVSAFAPTVLVAAGFSPLVALRLARWAARRDVSFGVWAGETRAMHTAHSRVRLAIRRKILAHASFLISYGFASGEYLRTLRPDLPLVYARNTSLPGPSIPRSAKTPVRLLAVGDLNSPRKGIDVLVAALALRPDLPCNLTVVGSGRELPGLERGAGGDPRVSFVGGRAPAEVRMTYAEHDVFVFPSRRELFGLALVEAMGAGLAVATAASAGAVADLCLNQENALVVEGHEPSAWARALDRLVSDSGLRAKLGAAARSTIARRWSIEHSADAMIAALRLGVITKKRHG